MRRLLAPAVAGVLLLAGCAGSARSPHATISTQAPPRTSSSVIAAPAVTTTRPAPARSTTSSSRPDDTVLSEITYPKGNGPLVVLNPGHNGGNSSHLAAINRQVPAGFGAHKECDTTGTTTNAGYPEHAYTWDVVRRTVNILRHHGVRVALTRRNDDSVGPCVDRRADIGNHTSVAAVVSIHGDGAPSSGHGFFVNTASRRPHGASRKVMRLNALLATKLRNGLKHFSGLTTSNYLGTNGIYKTSKFAALNLATRPAAFLEIGNMRNASDAHVQSTRRGREKIAKAVAAGILVFLAKS